MAARSGIAHRWSVLGRAPGGGSPVMPGGFYAGGMPGTAARMALYAEAAPALGRAAIEALRAQIPLRSEEHTSELQSLMRNSYAVFCLKKKKHTATTITRPTQ